MYLSSRNSICIIVIGLVLACSCRSRKVQYDLNGNWKIEGTGILLTSLEEDKTAFLEACKSKKISIVNNIITSDTTCDFFSMDGGIATSLSLDTEPRSIPLDSLDILNPELLEAHIFGIVSEENQKIFPVYTWRLNRDHQVSPVYVVVVDKDHLVFVNDPYILRVSRER